MEKRKVIGITPSLNQKVWDNLPGTYCGAVMNSGGLPVLLPPTDSEEQARRILDFCDGILFSGGVDIDPVYYGEDILNNTVEINEKRDKSELLLAKLAIEANKPILGICRGIQVLNVAMGGSLYQDLPSQLNLIHRQQGHGVEDGHYVNVIQGSPLHNILGEVRIKTNTYHHQSIKSLGKGFELIAESEDGVIESIYMPSKKYVLGVQWHPELLAHMIGLHKAIFDDFILNC